MNPWYSEVARRAGHRCEYCRAPEAFFNFPFQVEHVVPRSRGGMSVLDNLALACASCNLFKGDHQEAVESSAPRLFHPRTDTWSEHFLILESDEIIAISEIGRTTIERLRLNVACGDDWGCFPDE